ncbi:efflux RND transporter periplasmic adaptor subunit [Ohtaekwangia koreensis]|uniref:RND family efflux transporter, MFP subunit n=1 Tax=Ohtaekwangia koreensis TaxID=688867 RepID=A0A1T5JZY2_9BACT|nr:efflux RND transporter periplasmic adaptor subunit [Ohtaekwangia koreensis]SKC56845.1 RND family efflux transporter, MFP subunit [Ohtaekwangia koreensis]
MKSTIYTHLSVIVIAGMLAACSAATPDDKKAQLDKLKKQETEITKQIQQLEAEIAKTNPDSTVSVKAKEVSVTELAPRKFDHYVQTQGSVDAEDNILVSAKSAGVVTAVYVKEGQQVSKGQVLAQIDNSVIARNIEAQKSQLELAVSIFNRQKNLWDQKIGTEVQYLQAKTNKESLEKQIESLNEQNEMTRIKSPISGTVDEVVVKIGENIAPGMPAVRVVNTSNLKLIANVSEAYVTQIKKGNTATIDIPELKKLMTAQVTFVGKTIDPLSRTFPVEVKLPSNADLRPNMTGILKVIFHSEPSTIVVPVNIVQDLNKEKIVFIVETNGKQTIARKKVVTIEGVYDNLAQVKGLNAGDKVVTFGYQGLNDGQVIKI